MTDSTSNAKRARILYARVDEFARKEDKYRFLDDARSIKGVEWQELEPDAKHTWLTEGMHDEYECFIPLGTKEAKASGGNDTETIFKVFSNGVKTNRDDWVYNFDKEQLSINVKRMLETFNEQSFKWSRVARDKARIDDFVVSDEASISWSEGLKNLLRKGARLQFEPSNLRISLYRPFTKQYLYFNSSLNERRYLLANIAPTPESEKQNLIIAVTINAQIPFSTQMMNCIPCIDVGGRPSQIFPLYVCKEDGTNRRENITDWALAEFRAQYKDKSITKLDIFHYVYALLHHPTYRTTYAANLKRELPRIPFVKASADFRALASAGGRLADLHVDYEAQPEYPLKRVEQEDAALDWRVERMRLSKDKSSIVYNDFLTLEGIPPEAFEYRLGNRSALEWIIDQYQVSTDKRSGITNDPNRADEPDYIVKLIGKVTTVSVETVKIVRALPRLQLS